VPVILHDELLRVAPAATCVEVSTVAEAVPAALAMANPGDVVLLLYEKIEPVLAMLETLGARPVDPCACHVRQVEMLV
jgi:cyanophycin synthetase